MKYFVVSDVHGTLYALKGALEQAGFDPNNENHTLISLGDNFDRGGLARGVFKFLTHLPRAICLKGNHELILENVFQRGCLTNVDLYNGTDVTIASFAGISKSQAQFDDNAVAMASSYPGLAKWLADRPWYFETEHYIFTHAWVPLGYYKNKDLSPFTAADWEEAVWTKTEDAIKLHRSIVATNPSFKDKTIVAGHRFTWALREKVDGEVLEVSRRNKAIFDIWQDKENKIIAIDGCAFYSGQVNVLVVED